MLGGNWQEMLGGHYFHPASSLYIIPRIENSYILLLQRLWFHCTRIHGCSSMFTYINTSQPHSTIINSRVDFLAYSSWPCWMLCGIPLSITACGVPFASAADLPPWLLMNLLIQCCMKCIGRAIPYRNHLDHLQKLGPYVSILITANIIHFAVSRNTISPQTKNIPINWRYWCICRLNLSWGFFPTAQLTISQRWLRESLVTEQATSHNLYQWWFVYWRM